MEEWRYNSAHSEPRHWTGVNGEIEALAVLFPSPEERASWYSMDMSLGGSQTLSRRGDEKKFFLLPVIEPSSSAPSPSLMTCDR